MNPGASPLTKLWDRAEPYVAAGYSRLLSSPDLSDLAPIIVLGNQKTGSTAIAKLLAQYGGLSVTADIPPRFRTPVNAGPEELTPFIRRSHYYLRRDLVKDNTLTFSLSSLREVLPTARFIFVVRHPLQNIRSILDRLNLPGSPRPLASLNVPNGWRAIIRNEGLPLQADDHISALAKRWRFAAQSYLEHRAACTLVRYEDFLNDKETVVARLADRLGVAQRGDISANLNTPFQPRGVHRDTPLSAFFSEEALDRIISICQKEMDALNYKLPI